MNFAGNHVRPRRHFPSWRRASEDGDVPSTRADIAAPRWLVQLLRSTPAAIPWTRAGRAAVAIGVPLAASLIVGEVGIGALVSTGALPTVLAEAAGTYPYRARRICGAVAAAVTGFGIGLLCGASPALSFTVTVAIAAVSALVSAAGNNASIAALQLFVFTVLGASQQAVGIAPDTAIAFFAAGGVWGLLVALSGWTVHATSPERQAVAQVYIELAAMLSTQDEHASRAARHQLTTAMNTAYDRLLTARSWLSGRDAAYRSLLNMLSATTPAVEASVAMVNAGRRPPTEVIDHLTGVATAVLANTPPPDAPAPEHADPMLGALYAGLAKIDAGLWRARRPRVPARSRVREWAGSLVSGPLTWISALRLTLCVAVAETVGLLVPFERSYWITLTVGIVLKPDFGSVFGRAVLRGIGTVAGAGIGAAAIVLTSGAGPTGWLLVPLSAALAAGVAIGKVRNYGLLTAFVTPLIILEMELTAQGNWSVVLARLVDSVLGCAIVLIFGYLLWPGSMRPRVGGRLADMADTVAGYAELGLGPVPTGDDLAARSRSRRRAYRGLADLRTAFQQAVVEPSAAGRQASAWWPAIVGLERLTDAITEVLVTVEHGTPLPDAADVELITDALGELADAVRAQREPREQELPGTAQLSGVVETLGAVFDAVRGPDFDRQRRSIRLPGVRRNSSG